ncbi:hypothetical protein TorRG33x02_283270 [Trema orientale]|uniref:Uncharacterized protein n=1 Tax=Trema orientale TaxID=63057 RepID=A0A2P5CIN7_TREOI|nr:hypothetical protein TorRG33x02_283270 [Trema orientale]
MAWKRFKIKLSREPDHELPKWYQLQVFMKGLNPTSKSWVQNRYGFPICEERPENKAYQMMEDMAKFDLECFYFEESSRKLEEEESQDILVVEEVQEINDLAASLVYTSIPPMESYLLLEPPSQHYTLYKLEPKVKFPFEADHLKSSHFGIISNYCLYLVMLEDHYLKDPFVVMYATLYERQPLFDERSVESSRRR